MKISASIVVLRVARMRGVDVAITDTADAAGDM
jgi:hypothetical protein